MQNLLSVFFTIFGLLIGSFLNVVIYRMPRNLSVVTPRSKCPSCGYMVKWYENIPVFSWMFLRGKCSNCGVKISIKYPLIELLMGFIALLLAPTDLKYESLFEFVFYFSIMSVFIAHIFIDLEHHLLLDKLNIYLLLIIIPYVILNFSLTHWLVGGLVGFFGPFLVSEFYYRFRGIEGLGGGDIKLFGILGLIFGPVGVVLNIFLSCALGSVIGIFLIATNKLGKDTAFAFGPFIIIVAILQIFFPELIAMINPFVF